MTSIDNLVDEESIKEYASFIDSIPPQYISQLEQLYEGGQSDEFYHGIFKGIANAYATMQNQYPDFKQSLGAEYLRCLMIFLADKMLNKEKIH